MQMHDRNDEQLVFANLIEDRIWKPLRSTATDSLGNPRPGAGMVGDAKNGPLHLGFESKPCNSPIVIVDRFGKFPSGDLEETNSHQGRSSCASPETSSAGIALMAPRW
jgi:hypothetical protein